MVVFRFIFRFMALLIAMFIFFPLVLLTIYISQKIKNRTLNKWIINSWSKLLCKICGLSLTTKGFMTKNPVLIVANHVTWLDIPALHCFKLVGFVAKEEISHWPLLGKAVKLGETIFIARGKKESRKKVLESIEKRLRQGRSIAVFPEGKVTDGSYLARFHRQLIHAAVTTQTPVQAVAIKYLTKDGDRNKNITFVDNETFVKNVFRILCMPSSTVQLSFCESIETTDLSARFIAQKAFNQVSHELLKNDYL